MSALEELRENLIDGLIRTAERNPDFEGKSGGFEAELRAFEEAVWEEACEAQRKACHRTIKEHWAVEEIRDDVFYAILETESPESWPVRLDRMKKRFQDELAKSEPDHPWVGL